MNGRTATQGFITIFFAFLILIFNTSYSAPSSGTLTGKVVDAETGEALPGVNIVIEGTMRGAATDLEGAYRVKDLPAGSYSAVATMIGYAKTHIENVAITAQAVTKIDFALRTEALQGEEVVVTARALRNTEVSLLKDRQKAIAVSDAISAEAISQAGASNAAEAMKQVTGASVVEGKYVYVRGLGDRYTSTQLNGAEIPSADPYKRAGSIDLIPSNLIDNIVAIKSFTPDKQGNFSGGTVDIKTKDFPDQLNMKFSASSSFNTQTTFKSNGPLSYQGGGIDWLGMDDGTRGLPDLAKNGSFPTIPSTFDPQALDKLIDYSRSFSPVMTPTAAKPGLNQSYSLSIGNQFGLFNRPFGYMASLSYSNSYTSYDDGEYNAWNLGSQNASKLTPIFTMDDVKTTNEVLWGGLLKTSYKLTPKNIISLNYLYNINGESSARYLEGQYNYDKLDDKDDLFQSSILGFNERHLNSLQLNGEHQFDGLFGSRISWQLSSSSTKQDEPDVRYFSRYAIYDAGELLSYGTFSNIAPTRMFRTLDETNKEASLDISIPFKQWNGKPATFKLGGFAGAKERDFAERRFVYNEGTGRASYKGDPEKFFAPSNVGWDSTSMAINGVSYYGYKLKLYMTESDIGVNDYTGDQDISAWYAMLDLPLLNRLRFIGGARYETTDIRLVSLDETKADGETSTTDVLPSLNLIYSLTQNMNLRGSATRTLARPNFRELAPYASYDFSAGFTHIGNPALERTLIDNYDLRWEWFARPDELYGLSLFYKKFQNPIERAFIIQASQREITWENVDEAMVMGVELELRKNLDMVHDTFRHFTLGSNLSLVRSEINISAEQLALMRENNPDLSDKRELEGQSPYLVNVNLSYDNFNKGISGSVYFNVFGKRLSEVNKSGEPFIYEQPAGTLNASLSCRLMKNIDVNLSGYNLLNAQYKKTQVFKDVEYIFQRHTKGRTFAIGFGYSL